VSFTVAVLDDDLQDSAMNHHTTQINLLKMRKITREVMNDSKRLIVAGNDHAINISSKLWQKGIHRFALPSPPLLDSFEMGAPGNTKKLLDLSMVQGVVGINGSPKNFGELGSVWWR
jgi:hypothetical protein